MKELYNELTPRSQNRIAKPSNTSKNAIPGETQQLVRQVYEEDSNSRVMLGKKDVLSVRNQETNVKEKMRKRLLLDDIEELQKDYNSKHPENQVGKSKFFDFRPIWVIPVQKQSQDVCKCIYHENIDLIST